LSWIVWFFGFPLDFGWLTPRILKRYAAAIVAVLRSRHSANAAEKTPVILISIDTLRADHSERLRLIQRSARPTSIPSR
jgi:hypothetical protein